ncbi:MAG TPA: hypothetical protein VKM72_28130 [Thermoanaerobaculia bacterium]|nr:hypothetical protein [Thermoanaerobaculia bacterium]
MRRGVWIAGLAVALYLVGVAVQVRYDRRSVREVFQPGSVFNTSDSGLSLAYGYLQAKAARSGGKGRVGVLRRRIDPAELPARAVVFRVLPVVVPFLLADEEVEEKDGKEQNKDSKDEKEAPLELEPETDPWQGRPLLSDLEEAWVRGGGRLVLGVDGSYGPLSLDPIQGETQVRKVFPLWPGVSDLALDKPYALAGPPLAAGYAVFLAGEAPVVARIPVSAGDVILLSVPKIFQNDRLGQKDHLALLEGMSGLADGRPVLFDERGHGLGEDAGVIETLGTWGLGPLLAVAVLIGLLAVWRAAVRTGPPDRDDRDSRSDAVELVDSLADLYDRALRRRDAVRLYYESFVHAVAAETGLRGPALEARARTLLETGSTGAGEWETPAVQGDLPRDRFDRALRTLNQAFRRLQDAKRK